MPRVLPGAMRPSVDKFALACQKPSRSDTVLLGLRHDPGESSMTSTLPYGGQREWIGDLEVVPVFDGYSREDPTRMFVSDVGEDRRPGHRRADWDVYRDFLDHDGLLEHGLGGFLIRTGDHMVLVDTGVGPNQIGPYGPYDRVIKGGELPGRLKALGVDPSEITDVVFTHLHPDHYGWATHADATLFPRAT